MDVICLHDKGEIETYLRQDVALNIYSLGDLDDFFWMYTQWYAYKIAGEIRALVFLYTALSPPILLALAPPHRTAELRELLTQLLPLLPRRVYTHLSLGVEDVLQPVYKLASYGVHYKMVLRYPEQLRSFLDSRIVQVTGDQIAEAISLYDVSYPGNAFDARMLETGQFFGLWEDNQLVSIAGVHVYSPQYRVAAIGNVTTHPLYRNRGFGKAVTAALTLSLLENVDQIGLNVKQDNQAAINSYRQLGFDVVASYHELMASI
jgi:ribosomal protein S18 acetylase RimI-like enzyme